MDFEVDSELALQSIYNLIEQICYCENCKGSGFNPKCNQENEHYVDSCCPECNGQGILIDGNYIRTDNDLIKYLKAQRYHDYARAKMKYARLWIQCMKLNQIDHRYPTIIENLE